MKKQRGRMIECVNCGTEFLRPFQSDRTFCAETEECIHAGVMAKLQSYIEYDGDHHVWTGNVTTGFGIPRLDLHFHNRRITRRVVDILMEERIGRTYPFIERMCERERCVNLDHYMVAAKQSSARTIDAPLPLYPLMGVLEERPELRRKLNSIIRTVREAGFWTVSQADAVCCDHLNINPFLIYGDLFFTAGTEEVAA